MNQRERAKLIRELDVLKTRLRTHAIDVAYGGGRRKVRSLSEHIADIKRRDVIEALLLRDAQDFYGGYVVSSPVKKR